MKRTCKQKRTYKPYEALEMLAALERQYLNCPAKEIPENVLLEERALRDTLTKADLNGRLDYGIGYEHEEEAGTFSHVAHKLLEEYTVLRGTAESDDLDKLNKGLPEEEKVNREGLRKEAEDLYYAASNILRYEAVGDRLDREPNHNRQEGKENLQDEPKLNYRVLSPEETMGLFQSLTYPTGENRK